MKTSVTVAFAALAASVSAFHGQVSFHYSTPGEGTFAYLSLRDYDTGSTYTTQQPTFLTADQWRDVYFLGSGGYNFKARAKSTSSNCLHVDFQGALDSGWYFCCGGVPCDLQPK